VKIGANIRQEADLYVTLPPTIVRFRDDDQLFFARLDEHPDAFFVNSERKPQPSYLVLHRAACSHFSREASLNWTTDYVKTCSVGRRELEDWASTTVGGEVTPCRTCFG
jgi:hypothetical protein